MDISINPKTVRRNMLIIIATLAALHIQQLVIFYVIKDPEKFNFIRLLDFDYESNLPSLYSMLAILFCSVLLFLIGHAKKKTGQSYRFHWMLLGWVFLFLGFDEGAALHEDVGDLMEKYVVAAGYLYFPWVIPYSALVILLGLFYFRFILHLPKETMIRFIVAGALFLTGAVGIEILSAHEADTRSTVTILYSALYTVEELCEMVGIVIFAHALLQYYQREFGTLVLKLRE